MSAFFVTAGGDVRNVECIGGAKAVEGGFLLLGIGQDEILEWMEVPTPVALAWRDAVVGLLSTYRPRRPLKQLDWLGIAAGVDPQWSAAQGWKPAEPPAAAAPPPAPTPAPTVRRIADRPPPIAAE